MRDGVDLSANVFRPPDAGRVPVLLVRTPYGKGQALASTYRMFVEAGYAVVIQDVRGRGDSGGVFRPLDQEVADGHDTLDWIASQPWSNDRIGMLGGSYLGIVQWKAALSGSPFLKAISPAVSGSDEYEDRFYSKGGALKLGHRLSWFAENLRAPGFPMAEFNKYVWNLPLRTSDRAASGQSLEVFQEALNHPAYDSYWRSVSTREQLERVRIPVLAFGGWYDNFVENDLDAFRRLREMSREARIVVGPWPHNPSTPFPGFDFGQEAALAIRQVQLEWFDHWLKPPAAGPQQAPPGPPARLFVMGANRWKDEDAWPPPSDPKTFYLASGDRLSEQPAVESKPDSYLYDPRNPLPTMGGSVCCNPKIFPWGPMDQRPAEKRQDVLVYTSSPLDRDLEVTGAVSVVLWASTDAPDTDFTAKLSEVYADGRAINLCDGILRLRYRDSLERPALVKPGAVYRITIQAGVTSNVFRKGRRIRLDISSSNFPRFDRNPNTGRRIADETESRVARQTVYHDAKRPSQLVLPVSGAPRALLRGTETR
jgi:hypothetical protein